MLLTVLLFAASTAAKTPDAASHRAEVEAWRQKRFASLRREDGWLTLVGLFWLEQGENSFGSGRSNRIVFPEGSAPGFLGTIVLEGKKATLHAREGGGVVSGGKPAGTLALEPDSAGNPTVVTVGRISFYLIQRGERLGVRVKDKATPALASFRGIESFPVDLRWRFEARFDPYVPPRKVSVPNILGTVEQDDSPGAVVFEVDGRSYRLDAVKETGTDDLFLIFGDRTNGEETYGGGRFLYASPPDGSGRVVVDFNKAYNPPCVFTPYATCPLPPAQNRLPVRVEAGEKRYGNH